MKRVPSQNGFALFGCHDTVYLRERERERERERKNKKKHMFRVDDKRAYA